MHQTANGVMGHEEAPELLFHQLRRLTAQHDLGTAQMRLEFVQGGFYLPALVVKRRQFFGRSLGGVQDGGNRPVNRLSVFDVLQPMSITRTTIPLRWFRRSEVEA
jgi:hypothetical protein